MTREIMVDLAQEAFSTSNFDLAIDVFERTIKEHGPTSVLCLGLANSYAKTRQLEKALDVYKIAFRLGNIKPEQLDHLIELLVAAMGENKEIIKIARKKPDVFTCELCKGVWKDPVTLLCGHTYCRPCIEKENVKTCKQCEAPINSSGKILVKPNVVLQNTVEKWFAEEIQSAKLRDEGNDLFQDQKPREAIDVYSQAMQLYPDDHLLAGNRSLVYASLNEFPEALEDAELAVKLRPDWPKGHFHKGTALVGLNKYEEASFAFLQCLTLDNSIDTAQSALAKCLHKLMSPLRPEELKPTNVHSVHRASTLSQLIHEETSTLQTSDNEHDPEPRTSYSPPLTGFSGATLKQLQTCLAQKITEAGCSENNDPTHSSPVQALQSHGLQKCTSLPQSATTSPHQTKRASSETNLVMADSKQPRKKDAEVKQNRSPKQSICAPPGERAEAKDEAGRKSTTRTIAEELLQSDMFECTLCFRMLYQPSTTPCGHTYCRQCLDRCLDHKAICPLCKSSLVQYLAERSRNTTSAIENILAQYFPEQVKERQRQFEEEMAEMTLLAQSEHRNIPIFVCTIAYPTVPCPLHIFEPRYRLMVRRCMESGIRQFGMCINLEDETDSFAIFGTLLEIRDVQYLPDGRSIVNAVGTRPFKVASRDHKDGYHTGKVELLKDVEVPASERTELLALNDEVRREVQSWIDGLPVVPKDRIQQHFGSMPALEEKPLELINGPAWSWWTLAVLPLDNRAKLTILAMTSLRARISAIRRVLEFSQRRGQH